MFTPQQTSSDPQAQLVAKLSESIKAFITPENKLLDFPWSDYDYAIIEAFLEQNEKMNVPLDTAINIETDTNKLERFITAIDKTKSEHWEDSKCLLDGFRLAAARKLKKLNPPVVCITENIITEFPISPSTEEEKKFIGNETPIIKKPSINPFFRRPSHTYTEKSTDNSVKSDFSSIDTIVLPSSPEMFPVAHSGMQKPTFTNQKDENNPHSSAPKKYRRCCFC